MTTATLKLDYDKFQAIVQDFNGTIKQIALTPVEWNILSILDSSDRVVSKTELVNVITERDVKLNTVETHVANIRKKIGWHFILTVRGFGYQFNPQVVKK